MPRPPGTQARAAYLCWLDYSQVGKDNDRA